MNEAELIAHDLSPLRGLPICVVGSGNSELSEADESASRHVGEALAKAKAQLIVGLSQGVDRAVLRAYQQAVGTNADRAHRIHLVAPERDLKGFTIRHIPVQRVITDTNDAFIEEFLIRASIVIIIGGRGFCYRVYQEALKRDMSCIPMPGTGGDAARIDAELSTITSPYQQSDWLQMELKHRTETIAPKRWVAVAGYSGRAEAVSGLWNTCDQLGQYLAELRVGLRTGCRSGVDQKIAQAYVETLLGSSNPPDPRRFLVQTARLRNQHKYRYPGRVEIAPKEADQFSQMLDGVSALFVLNGLRGTMQTVAEAARRGILILPLATTGGVAKSIAARIPKMTVLNERIAKYNLSHWENMIPNDRDYFAQLLYEPRYPEIPMDVIDIPEDADNFEVLSRMENYIK